MAVISETWEGIVPTDPTALLAIGARDLALMVLHRMIIETVIEVAIEEAIEIVSIQGINELLY